MPSDLELHLNELRVVDTHEHQMAEKQWLEKGPADVLADLFYHYSQRDLISAGAPADAIARMAAAEGDLESRWKALEPAWTRASSSPATARPCASWRPRCTGSSRSRPSPCATLSRGSPSFASRASDIASSAMCAVTTTSRSTSSPSRPILDDLDPAFFLYDVSWAGPSCGRLPAEQFGLTGIEIRDLAIAPAGDRGVFREARARLDRREDAARLRPHPQVGSMHRCRRRACPGRGSQGRTSRPKMSCAWAIGASRRARKQASEVQPAGQDPHRLLLEQQRDGDGAHPARPSLPALHPLPADAVRADARRLSVRP